MSSGVGVAHGKIFTLFGSSQIKVLPLDEVTKKRLYVKILSCDFTKTVFVEYHFRTQEFFDEFIKKSKWHSLPYVNLHGARFFNRFEDGEFKFTPS